MSSQSLNEKNHSQQSPDIECLYCGVNRLDKNSKLKTINLERTIHRKQLTWECQNCGYKQRQEHILGSDREETTIIEDIPEDGFAVISETGEVINTLIAESTDDIKAELQRADSHRPTDTVWYVLLGRKNTSYEFEVQNGVSTLTESKDSIEEKAVFKITNEGISSCLEKE